MTQLWTIGEIIRMLINHHQVIRQNGKMLKDWQQYYISLIALFLVYNSCQHFHRTQIHYFLNWSDRFTCNWTGGRMQGGGLPFTIFRFRCSRSYAGIRNLCDRTSSAFFYSSHNWRCWTVLLQLLLLNNSCRSPLQSESHYLSDCFRI